MKRMLPEEYMVAAAVMVMVLMVAAQVASRYFLHVSLSHTEEIVRYLFVWATVLGASAAARRGRHISISSDGPSRRGRLRLARRVMIGAGRGLDGPRVAGRCAGGVASWPSSAASARDPLSLRADGARPPLGSPLEVARR